MKTFIARLFSTVVLLAVFGGAAWWNSPYGYGILVCLLCNLASLEWRRMLGSDEERRQPLLLLAASLVYPWALAAMAEFTTLKATFVFPAVYLAGYVLLAFFSAMRGSIEGGRPLAKLGAALVAFLYPGWLFSLSIFFIFFDYRFLIFVIWLVLTTKMADIFAYVCGVMLGGSVFGERRFSPRISPKKTWEGIVGSFILTSAASYFLYLALMDSGSFWGWSFAWFLPTMAVLFVLAVAGDLAGSLVKRSLQVKDSGSLLPGIGGVFDLIDSPAFTVGGFCVLLYGQALRDYVA